MENNGRNDVCWHIHDRANDYTRERCHKASIPPLRTPETETSFRHKEYVYSIVRVGQPPAVRVTSPPIGALSTRVISSGLGMAFMFKISPSGLAGVPAPTSNGIVHYDIA